MNSQGKSRSSRADASGGEKGRTDERFSVNHLQSNKNGLTARNKGRSIQSEGKEKKLSFGLF